MGYDKLAVQVVDAYNSSRTKNPLCEDELIKGWDKEGKKSKLSKANDCPKATFLGICTAGHVLGIPEIHYSSSIRNRIYGETAIKLLKAFPSLVSLRPTDLWNLVTSILKTYPKVKIAKKHNHQMDVILGLWKRGYIKLQ